MTINSPISISPNWINWEKNYAHHHVKGSKEEILAVYKVAIATKDMKTRLGSKPIYKYGLLPFFSARERTELNKFGNLNPNRHSGAKLNGVDRPIQLLQFVTFVHFPFYFGLSTFIRVYEGHFMLCH